MLSAIKDENKKDSVATTQGTTTSKEPVKKVDTDGAIKKAQEIYDTYYNTDYTKGRVAQGPYKDSNPIGQLYLNYIDSNKSWFSDSFAQKAEAAVKNNEKDVLICFDGSATISAFKASLVDEKDGAVNVSVTETVQGGTKTFKASLKQVSGSWVVDSLDFSGCSS